MSNTTSQSRALGLPDLEHLKVYMLREDKAFGPQQVLEWKGNSAKGMEQHDLLKMEFIYW